MPRTTKPAAETTRKTTTAARKTTTSTRKPRASTAKSRTKVIDREQAGKYLARVPEERVFWCNDGAILKDMSELRDSLKAMSDQTFNYHHNEIKKDFSAWIKDVIGDDELARELEAAHSRDEAAKVVEKRCSLLVEKAE